MFKSNGTSAATATDKTDGDFVASFVLNDQFSKIPVKDLTWLFADGCMNYTGRDKGVFLGCGHPDSYTGDDKYISIFK